MHLESHLRFVRETMMEVLYICFILAGSHQRRTTTLKVVMESGGKDSESIALANKLTWQVLSGFFQQRQQRPLV